ncbi:MAG: DUF3084 domain-containing protein [Negativicutes bacterium]|nr:DUF3084 domain-containing protein [Negativicutes bacterium]
MYGLQLIAVLAVMGGIIAYIGDKLGTKVGKKKLTIFGLRPKHTSILVTIVTGILIAAATLGVLSVASRDVRTALFGMEQLKEQMAVLSGEVTMKNKELEESRQALAAKTAELTALSARIAETSRRLTTITQELAAVMDERDRTAAALAEVQQDYSAAKGDLVKARQDIDTLTQTKNDLDARVAALNEAKTNLQADVDKLSELTANLKKGIQFVREGVVIFRAGEVLSTSVIKGGENAKDTEATLAAILYRTNQGIVTKLGADKDLEVLWVSRPDFEQAVSLIAATPEDIIVRVASAGNTIYGEPVIGQINLFPNRLVYKQDAIVHTEAFDAGSSAAQAEETVLKFLQKVNQKAIEQGVLPDPLQGTVGEMSGSQLYDTINRVKRAGGKVELTATAKNDIYAVGPLRVEVKIRSMP